MLGIILKLHEITHTYNYDPLWPIAVVTRLTRMLVSQPTCQWCFWVIHIIWEKKEHQKKHNLVLWSLLSEGKLYHDVRGLSPKLYQEEWVLPIIHCWQSNWFVINTLKYAPLKLEIWNYCSQVLLIKNEPKHLIRSKNDT